MKSIINYLFFDKEVIENIKKRQLTKDQLYSQLVSGRITLMEYAKLTK